MQLINIGAEDRHHEQHADHSGAARFGDSYQYADLVDSVLYESADSYAQAQLLYLQNRRFTLSGGAQPDFEDPYEELFGDE